jgi:TPR repeat protein
MYRTRRHRVDLRCAVLGALAAVLLIGCRARHAETPDAESAAPEAVASEATPESPGDSVRPRFDVPTPSWAIDDHLPSSSEPLVSWSPAAADVPGLLTALAAELDADDRASSQIACEGGDGASCRRVAAAAIDGTPEGIEASLALLQLGCMQRDETSCAWLVAMLDRGAAGGQIASRLGPACTRGVATACAGLGWAAAGRIAGAAAAPAEAEALLIRGCDEGSGLSCALLGVVLDDARSTALFERGCEAGEAVACVAAGVSHERVADRGGARDAFAAGCELADPTSCRLEGVFVLETTNGVLDDAARAALSTACEGVDVAACALLAERLMAQDDLVTALEEATPWFVTACNLGDGESCHRFARSIGADAPTELLDDLRRRACEGGVTVDCEPIGE